MQNQEALMEAASVRDQAADWMRSLAASGISNHVIANGVLVALTEMLLRSIGREDAVKWFHLQTGNLEAVGEAWEKALKGG